VVGYFSLLYFEQSVGIVYLLCCFSRKDESMQISLLLSSYQMT